ncbi:hypothetical protein K1719_002830 [Acacia pycnantha]|nr:hypothetical protein K1719_002830 [Acacia pycnantha]
MTVTKDVIAHFDWSSFILQELCEEIHEFKKDSQKSKRKQSKTIGGCLYFLMLFCFQNFPLGDVIPSQHESPMAFWTDEKVKNRVLVEKRSKKGLLVVHTTYARLLSNLQQEMLALQHTLSEEGHHEGDAPNKHPSTSEESDDDNGHDIEEGDDIDEGDQAKNIIDVEEIPQNGEETPHVDAGLSGEQGEDAADPKHQSEPVQQEVKEPGLELRRSQRLITMVAKTLVADQLEHGGVVHRHIFTADFMAKMISAERKWTVESNVAEILPKHVGYNIGDCHFIFGPTLFLNHWFCYVLDTTMMVFYALDSLVENITYYRMQYEKGTFNQIANQEKAKKEIIP